MKCCARIGTAPKVKAIPVEVITVAQAIERAGWETADVLVIDAEGFDAVIVRNVLDTELKFDLIFFEHLNIPLHDYRTLRDQLHTQGYALVVSGKDTVAVQPSFLDRHSPSLSGSPELRGYH